MEADVVEGVRCVPASIYLGSNVRICRCPGGSIHLHAQRKAVTTHALALASATSTICERG